MKKDGINASIHGLSNGANKLGPDIARIYISFESGRKRKWPFEERKFEMMQRHKAYETTTKNALKRWNYKWKEMMQEIKETENKQRRKRMRKKKVSAKQIQKRGRELEYDTK